MKKMNVDKKAFVSKEVNELIENELKSLKEDELVYPFIRDELKLTAKEARLYLAHLLNYQEDVHYCASCPGLEECDKALPRFCIRLVRDGDVISREYAPCPKVLSLASFQNRYLMCSFSPDWRDANIEGIERSASSRNKTIKTLYMVAEKGEKRWPYLIGNSGSGKTYMLACFANQITTHEGVAPGAFCDTGTLLSKLKDLAIKNHDAFIEKLTALQKCSVLVLDDFGNEFKSDFVYTSVLFPLLSYRDKEKLPTAFSSDFKISDIVSMYQSKIGVERAHQLRKLLERNAKGELDVSGQPIH